MTVTQTADRTILGITLTATMNQNALPKTNSVGNLIGWAPIDRYALQTELHFASQLAITDQVPVVHTITP